MELLDGKALAQEIKNELTVSVKEIVKSGKRPPHLAAVLVGEHAPSLAYVNGKVKACKEVGYDSTLVRLSESISQDELLAKVQELNNDEAIDGFIVQLPLPTHIDENVIIESILPAKDVDGFHPENVGKMALGLPSFVSATPLGIMEMLKRNKIETEGKHCVVVGRSNIVGTPMSILMGKKSNPGNSTVTLAHSRTKNLKEVCASADILIAAIGRAAFITEEMVKEGAVVIDVGINRVDDASKKRGYRLVGDVDFEAVAEKSSYITPVPGGVGPMTIVSLMVNTHKAYLASR